MGAWLRGLVLSLMLTAVQPLTAAVAQEATGDRAASFEAVSGPVKEDVPGGPLLLAAYALIWLFLLAYVIRLARLHKGLSADVARLQQDLGRATKRAETPK